MRPTYSFSIHYKGLGSLNFLLIIDLLICGGSIVETPSSRQEAVAASIR